MRTGSFLRLLESFSRARRDQAIQAAARLLFSLAGKMPDDFARSIEDIERDLIFWRGLEIIIDDCAGRRVIADRLALVEFLRVMQTQRGLRLIENHVCLSRLRVHLTKRRQVIEHPERTPMRRHHQIVIFDHKIVNRRDAADSTAAVANARRHRTKRTRRVSVPA